MAENVKKSRSGKLSCLAILAWGGLALFSFLAIVFFSAGSLFDLGVWDEFWEMISKKF